MAPLSTSEVAATSPVYRASLIAAGVHETCCLPLPQEQALRALCDRYRVGYDPPHYRPAFDLPKVYVACCCGGPDIQAEHPTIYVGCSPEGRISS